MNSPRYFDCHSHLNFSHYDEDRDEVVARMREKGVWTITVGTNLETSREAVALAKRHEGIFATVGVHPTDEEDFDDSKFKKLVENSKVVAVGECGLDYFRLPSGNSRENQMSNDKIKERQKELFLKQIAFAAEHNKPLMIHGRPSRGTMDAYEDILETISNFQFPISKPGNVHFFVGNPRIAKRFLDLGFTLSFDGPITFTREYDETVRFVPLDMILAETDAPFASPDPYRGKRNEPSYVVEVARAIAAIRGQDEEEVRQQLTKNTRRVFAV